MKSRKLDLLLDLRVEAFASADKLPDRVKVLAWGENPTASGRIARVGPKTLSALPAMQKRLGYDEIALDYEHNTVPGTRAYADSEEPRSVAAYGTLEVVDGQGVFFVPSRWTPSGQKKAFEFQDLSPAPATGPDGEVVFVHSVALCRNGDINDLRFVPFTVEPEPPENPMDYKATLLKLLKLPEDATDETIESAVAAVGEPDAMGATVRSLEARITALSAGVEAVKAGDLKRQREAICARAAAEGKVIPLAAEQLEKTDLAVLADMVAKLPVTVPIDRRTPQAEPLSAPGANPAIARYNAITDPDERARFYAENREKILGKG